MGKKKKEGLISRAAHAVEEMMHPHHDNEDPPAEESADPVDEILDQVSDEEHDQRKGLKVKSPARKSDAKIEQHPKFDKFKKGSI